jgi:adenylate kinase
MIFVSGIHGVGKSYFCDKVKQQLNINSYSASSLISDLKQEEFSKNKLILDIGGNQPYLLLAVEKLNKQENTYLLDGHFCLLNSFGAVQRIPMQTFIDLSPKAIILLTEKENIIAERRKHRDCIEHDRNQIYNFQQEELLYVTEVSEIIDIPLFVSTGAKDIDEAIAFVERID